MECAIAQEPGRRGGLLVIHIFIVEVEDADGHVVGHLGGALGVESYGFEVVVERQAGLSLLVIGLAPQEVGLVVGRMGG